MSHPPEHIPDIDNQTPAKVKTPKEKELKDKTKEKVKRKFISLNHSLKTIINSFKFQTF